MRVKLSFLIIILLVNKSFAQNILEQSNLIAQNETYYKGKLQVLLAENSQYNVTETDREVLKNLENFYANPFQNGLKMIDLGLVDYIIDRYLNMTSSSSRMTQKSGSFDYFTGGSGLNISSGINFSSRLIDGTAAFIAGKVKRELSILFYEKMSAKLKDTLDFKFRERTLKLSLQNLLPYSNALIDTKHSFEVPAFGATWIAAFQNDLNQFPFSLIDEFRKDSVFTTDEKGRYVSVLFDGLNDLYNGYSTANTIESLSSKYQKFETYKIDYQLAIINIIIKNSNDIDKNDSDIYKLNDYSKLNQKGKKYFVGLFYQDALQHGLNKNKNFNINETNYLNYFEFIKEVQMGLRNISLTALNSKNNNSENASSDFKLYANLFIDIFHSINENEFDIKSLEIENNIKNYRIFYDDVYYKEYIPIAKSILGIYDGMNTNNYGSSLIATISLLNHLSYEEKNYKFIKELTFFGNFMVDMIAASENENINIENILNKYAMPVTSYRVKRHYRSSIDISAYPGLNLGYEFSKSNSPSFGITAPIGFSFSWRSDSKEIYAPSHSLFISAIDLGAPISYRLMNDAANGLPENIKWKQIFSPGLFYIYGFKNAPMCLSVGVQYTPLLRKIETDSILEEENVVKAGISLMVDIPLFSIYKNTKNSDH